MMIIHKKHLIKLEVMNSIILSLLKVGFEVIEPTSNPNDFNDDTKIKIKAKQ